jgi:hypothetical protein
MTRTPVTSSQIQAIGYDPTTKTMQIAFVQRNPDKPQSVYEYSQVPAEVHAALIGAESIGKAFGQTIKPFPGTFPHRKLTPEEAAQP